MNVVRIGSIRQLQKLIGRILDRLNADQVFALAAAANPLHALEELGFELEQEVRFAIEDRCRFGSELIARRQQLRDQIFRLTDRVFDVSSESEILHVLDELGLRPKNSSPTEQQWTRVRATTSAQGFDRLADVLEQLKDAHPVAEPLLEYWRIDGSVPRFASSALYQEVRTGRRKVHIAQLQARLTT